MKNDTLSEIKKILTKADFFLIVILLIFSLIFVSFSRFNSDAKEIEIYQDSKLIKTVKSTTDQIIKLSNGIEIEIKGNKARIIKSDCKHQICIKQGWNDTFPIACIPNKTMVVFKSKHKMLITK
jgi:hypothetical protein